MQITLLGLLPLYSKTLRWRQPAVSTAYQYLILYLLLIFGIANMITTTITAGITRLVIILGTSKTGTAKASSTSRNQFVNYYFLQ